MSATDVTLLAVVSFLSGGFLTALGFVLGYSTRLTRVEEAIKALAIAPTKQCPLHEIFDKRVSKLEDEHMK